MIDLPDVLPEVDISVGLPRLAGNKKLYKKLLLQVADSSLVQHQQMTTAVTAGELTAVRELAHSLKGAAGNLSITRLHRTAEQLELAAKQEDFPGIFTALDAMEYAIQDFMSAVAVLRD